MYSQSIYSSNSLQPMNQDRRRSSHFYSAAICVLICTPPTAAGYAAGAVHVAWLLVAVLWTALLVVFFSYSPEDDEIQ